MELSFEWDARKAAANRKKHGVSFEEALTVFGDLLARIFDDPDHSATEAREIIVGPFRARKATRKERKDYENPESW